MGVDLRLPNITAETPEGQITQLRSYMYQLVGQLNWALDSIANGTLIDETPSEAEFATKSEEAKEPNTQEAQENFNQIKALILKNADILEHYEEEMQTHFDGRYIADSEYGTFKQTTQATLSANSQDITQLYTNTQEIETNVTGLDTRVDGLNTNVSGLNTQVGSLGTQVGGLSSQVGSLNDQVSGIESDVTGLGTQVSGIGAQVSELSSDVTGLDTQVSGLGTNVSELSNSVTELSGSVDGVASSVDSLSSDLRTKASNTDLSALEGRVGTAERTIDPITTSNESTTIRKAQAYIKTGLLDEDEQLYGVEVGRTREVAGQETSGYARFTHDGVYFYLPNVTEPVAFLQDYFMQVQTARFPESIAIRGYTLDTKLGGIAFRWTGDSQ